LARLDGELAGVCRISKGIHSGYWALIIVPATSGHWWNAVLLVGYEIRFRVKPGYCMKTLLAHPLWYRGLGGGIFT